MNKFTTFIKKFWIDIVVSMIALVVVIILGSLVGGI